MKFKVGDRIIDSDPFFGIGTIIDVNDEDDTYYSVKYDSQKYPTTGCPEHEMRLLTKLDKALQ